MKDIKRLFLLPYQLIMGPKLSESVRFFVRNVSRVPGARLVLFLEACLINSSSLNSSTPKGLTLTTYQFPTAHSHFKSMEKYVCFFL